MSKVIVGLSGGVDSAVAAWLLLEQGFTVEGLFMKNWEDDDTDSYCSSAQDLADVEQICTLLNIKLHTVNFAKAYKERVFNRCLDEFARGYTPNPDTLCNQEIKFKLFLEHAQTLHADYIATGHYARVDSEPPYRLLTALDPHKDQSYFLYTMRPRVLKQLLLPIGTYHKTEVRAMAKRLKLPVYNKKDSTGICFIGERPFKSFLQSYLRPRPGLIVDEVGKTLGQHEGLMFYTIGQRSGLNLGGQKGYRSEPWYVLDKNLATNHLIVGQGSHHPRLYDQHLISQYHNWITPVQLPYRCTAKIRYRQPAASCLITATASDICHVAFDKPQRAITPGQAIVFYDDEVCLGGGIIQQKAEETQKT